MKAFQRLDFKCTIGEGISMRQTILYCELYMSRTISRGKRRKIPNVSSRPARLHPIDEMNEYCIEQQE